MDDKLRETMAKAISNAAHLMSHHTAMMYADAAIAAMPFNLLEHLKAGGKAVNMIGDCIEYIYGNIVWEETGYQVVYPDIMTHRWQPYDPPEWVQVWYWYE